MAKKAEKKIPEAVNELDRLIREISTVAKKAIDGGKISNLGVVSALDFVAFNLRSSVRESLQMQIMQQQRQSMEQAVKGKKK